MPRSAIVLDNLDVLCKQGIAPVAAAMSARQGHLAAGIWPDNSAQQRLTT
jgi:hypothetical protein